MKQTARIISTYSADTFGVCSALFELGGMVVMHGPRSCELVSIMVRPRSRRTRK